MLIYLSIYLIFQVVAFRLDALPYSISGDSDCQDHIQLCRDSVACTSVLNDCLSSNQGNLSQCLRDNNSTQQLQNCSLSDLQMFKTRRILGVPAKYNQTLASCMKKNCNSEYVSCDKKERCKRKIQQCQALDSYAVGADTIVLQKFMKCIKSEQTATNLCNCLNQYCAHNRQ